MRDLDKTGGPELSIVMPCLNESETLATCIEKALAFFKKSGTDGEIIVADNCSEDGSQAIAKDLGVRVIEVVEKGYGAALLGGIKAAKGRYVIMGDADDSYDFSRLDSFLTALRAGHDLVMGNRFKGGIQRGAMPWLHRYLGNPILSFLGRLFYGAPIRDFHCGLRGFSKASIERLGLRSSGMEFASEMVVKASLNKLSITEVPTTLSPDGRSRQPHLRRWRDGWRHLRFLLLHSHRWLFLYPGLAMTALGLLAAAMVSYGRVRITPTLELGVHTLVVGCFSVLIGIQLIVFSALADKHAESEGYLPFPKSRLFINAFRLENVLIVALGLFLSGGVGCAWAVYYWANVNFGPITYPMVLNTLIISLTTVAVSIQLAYAAFLASVFEIRK